LRPDGAEAAMTVDDYALIVAALQDALKNSKPEEHEGILTATVHIAQRLKNQNPLCFRMAKFIDVVCNQGFCVTQSAESSLN
jgi:hypothetical protein